MHYTCLSVEQPFASAIAEGLKTVEVRSWRTAYRGLIVICSTAKNYQLDGEILPGGVALGTVELVDCRPLCRADLPAAGMDGRCWRKKWKNGTPGCFKTRGPWCR